MKFPIPLPKNYKKARKEGKNVECEDTVESKLLNSSKHKLALLNLSWAIMDKALSN